MTSSTIYPVKSIGGPLAERVPRSGRWGTVFAVFRRSCYLESGGGQVFCLADQGLGEGPLTLVVKFPSETTLRSLGISEGCHLDTDGVDLVVGHELVLTTAETVIWEPDPVASTAPVLRLFSNCRAKPFFAPSGNRSGKLFRSGNIHADLYQHP